MSINVDPGEFLVLLGPSGCGKTTLLRMIAGLEKPDRGHISLNGSPVFDSERHVDLPPERRPASMVFQSYALWPHMTVFDNVAYPLRSQRVARDRVQKRVTDVLEIVGIGHLHAQFPNQLSGGQQQRVSLARAIVASQDVILFDEPLSNIDAKVREKLRLEIIRMQRELGFTALYVTHDQDEAMTLGTRIAVLDEGVVAQIDTPRAVYERPASAYVAAFVGTVDEFKGSVIERSPGHVRVRTTGQQEWDIAIHDNAMESVVVMARPERWTLAEGSNPGRNRLTGIVVSSMYLAGSRMQYLVRTAEGIIRVWASHGAEISQGAEVTISQTPADLLAFGRES
ncbi:Fe3+/spermidine/putrescine ABC transporter ATP-binding protein [Microbacterium faecale]|uniref:Fe3+/spermidine/putrescine ABC transporter ATP-binding protein n=1 Tax=Microbacterium faecale TaxID=1804630 RepID=A0A917DEZ3_9MICO|nr:Fe3+/spermidine/putrescine ABC transporter ATP-binding protein [Microbacterium faecale]